MAEQITNYQCPACTGPLHFVGESGKLECDYCGSSYTVEEINELYKDKNEQAAEAHTNSESESESENTLESEGEWSYSGGTSWGEDAQKLHSLTCPSCSAELICDENTAATQCPYCGNPSIVPGQFSNSFKPDYIIPFKLDKAAAKQALKNYYNGKKLLPKAFASENQIEKIQGVYVPFWLYDGEVDADLKFNATRSHSHIQGDYRVTITEHYRLRRGGSVNFERIPVDASSKMPNAHMDSVEPFDYSELKPFSMGYMPGYLADKFDVSASDCSKRADERAANTAVSLLAGTATGYDTCTIASKNIKIRHGEVSYAFLPVWLLSTKWNGENYLFAMNGQTGRLIGNLPISKFKLLAWFAGIALPLIGILSLWML